MLFTVLEEKGFWLFVSGCGAGASFAFSLGLTLGLVGQNVCEGFQDPLTIGLATFREASPLPCP